MLTIQPIVVVVGRRFTFILLCVYGTIEQWALTGTCFSGALFFSPWESMLFGSSKITADFVDLEFQ